MDVNITAVMVYFAISINHFPNSLSITRQRYAKQLEYKIQLHFHSKGLLWMSEKDYNKMRWTRSYYEENPYI